MRIMVSGVLATGICLLLHAAGVTAEEPLVDRQMAITFDDLPAQRAHALPEARISAINHYLVRLMGDQGIPAIGFVNENKLHVDESVDAARVRLLELWLDAGLELGNHTFSHPDLHRSLSTTPSGSSLVPTTRHSTERTKGFRPAWPGSTSTT